MYIIVINYALTLLETNKLLSNKLEQEWTYCHCWPLSLWHQ